MIAIENERLQIPEETWEKLFSTAEKIRANMEQPKVETVCPICKEISVTVEQRDYNTGYRIKGGCKHGCFAFFAFVE